MAERKTYDEVKRYIESFDGYKLLSDSYINNSTKLILKCPNNHTFPTDWAHFLRGRRCPHCYEKNKQYKIEEVSEYLNKYNYKLISNEYVNVKTDLIMLCPNKHTCKIDFDHFKNSGTRCPECSDYKREDGNIVYNAFIEKGLLPLFKPEDYINATIPMEYICNIHTNIHQKISYGNIKQGKGCKFCGYDKYSGENCHLWKGGTTELNHYLRHALESWNKQILEQYNYKCVLTGINTILSVHHLISFNNIVQDTMNKLQLEIKKNISEYTNEDLINIKNTFLEYHTSLIGIPLLPKLHYLFHQFYGFGNNTPEQFEEFKTRLKLGEFDDYLKENSLKIII